MTEDRRERRDIGGDRAGIGNERILLIDTRERPPLYIVNRRSERDGLLDEREQDGEGGGGWSERFRPAKMNLRKRGERMGIEGPGNNTK